MARRCRLFPPTRRKSSIACGQKPPKLPRRSKRHFANACDATGSKANGDWWKAIYQVMFGEDQGPRFGSFAAIYGIANTRKLIAKALDGELISEHEAFLAAREPVDA